MAIDTEVDGFLQELVLGVMVLQTQNALLANHPGQHAHFPNQFRRARQPVRKGCAESQSESTQHGGHPEFDQGYGKRTPEYDGQAWQVQKGKHGCIRQHGEQHNQGSG